MRENRISASQLPPPLRMEESLRQWQLVSIQALQLSQWSTRTDWMALQSLMPRSKLVRSSWRTWLLQLGPSRTRRAERDLLGQSMITMKTIS